MPEAPRLWVKLDAGFYDDPRLMGAGERGELLFLRSLAWSRRNLTDGWLPPGVVERLMPGGEEEAARLVGTGALKTDKRGGFEVVAFLRWQDSAADVKARRDSGRRAARRRWDAKPNGTPNA
jgi:hypothetical protein